MIASNDCANGAMQIPAGAATVDLTHATVLPGLIDCHTHIMLADTDDSHYDEILLKQSWQYRTILATLNVKRDLEAGFTAMRDVETKAPCIATSTFATRSTRD